tara:strand:- start:2328 stop:3488 length:1161 start_codon:yes stop_codon:yes gene_type:complete
MSQKSQESLSQSIPKSSLILPSIKVSEEKDGILSFTLENANVSVANALRRTILSDVNTVVMDTSLDAKHINIIKNTTRFNNEILKQRLSCIPVHIKDHDVIENLIVEINEVNDTDSIVYITTKDFKIKNIETDTYLDDEATRDIFPPDPLTGGHILFARLRPKISNDIPGQELQLECKLSVSNASHNGMYNVVSTCAYENTPDKVEQNTQWQVVEQELEEKGYSKKDVDDFEKNWKLLRAKRFYLDKSFDFKIQTIGVYTNMELIHLAIDVIVHKLNKINEICQNDKLILNKTKTTMRNSVDVLLENEDYTIGKVIEYILHDEYYRSEDRVLAYVGFIKMHPHDTDSIIRMSFNEEKKFTDENIRSVISYACQTGIKIFTNLKEFF